MSTPPNYQTILTDLIQMGDAVQGTNGLWAQIKNDESDTQNGYVNALIQLGQYATQLNNLSTQLTAAGAPQDVMAAFQNTIAEIKQAKTDLMNTGGVAGIKKAYADIQTGTSSSPAINTLFTTCLNTATNDAFNNLQSSLTAYQTAYTSNPTAPSTIAAFNSLATIFWGLGNFLEYQMTTRGASALAAALGIGNEETGAQIINKLVNTSGTGLFNQAWTLSESINTGYAQTPPVAPSPADNTTFTNAIQNSIYLIVA